MPFTNAAALLAEHAAGESRSLANVEHPTTHTRLTVFHAVSGAPFDDHDTEYGQCHTCLLWICRTSFVNGDVTDRCLRPDEISALQLIDDRYRRADA